ncbi:hypothetical protein N7537_011863 [Penicillium hordei]|uniref:Integral membrane protein n=1 Tax=Penicillium hordei TaxID=40994 RepID=A0AAD6GUH2_9EURO|nr:uncharacterized protein N7537_011863 [Penicillium hordei]KAJ5589185.1 hypothetical protein N7537_011863 [Penicillium hordei]
MQLRSRSWMLVLIFTLNILACEAGWVSKFQCGSSELRDPRDTPFRIDSLRGKFESPTIFSLSILAIHNTTYFTCSNLDLPLLETSFRFHVLGIPVGQMESFHSECPLPITETLTPQEGTLFSNYEILYSFGNARRLQTAVAEIRFKTQDGAQLDCVAAKITPQIGTAASVIFTYLPAVVMALVGVASWKTHANDALRWISFIESRAAWSILGPMWEVISDLAVYLQYLQFIFLAGSLTLKYPGFYQPIVSQVAWSSLLYWMGPINHGFTYPGVEDGMYVTNGTYGLEYMSQTLGFPQMPDITIDSFINLSILLFAVVIISLILCLIMSRLNGGFHLTSVTWNAGCIIIGMALSFSSLPLLSYLSYELILIGYLPNYRIILVGLSIAVLVYSNFLITRHVQRQKELNDSSSPDFSQGARSAGSSMKPRQYLSQYLPAAIPLLQGIVIGGLQDWGLVQVLLLMGTEIILLLHMGISLRGRLFLSISAWQPRHHYKDPPNRSSALNNSHEETAENPYSNSHPPNSFQDSFDEFMEVPIRPNVDYSMRESDLFYGKSGNGFASPVPISQVLPEESQESRSTLREWAVRAAEILKPPKKKKEKGFQVMRPPRQN